MAHPNPSRAARVAPHRIALLPLSAALLLAPAAAHADGFASPPEASSRRVVVIDRGYDAPSREVDFPPFEPDPSVVRFFVGPAGKLDGDSATAGLLTAVDIGKGPAGFRLTGAWMDVGGERGLSQYTGELTIDFGGRSRVRPVVGAGAGVARTSTSVDATGAVVPDQGATMGVGILRAGLGVRLPLEDADARIQLDLTGALAAIRGDDAPDLSPWVLTSVTVGIGF